jgi:hypothetical protein
MRAGRRNRHQHVEQRLARGRAGALDREQPSLGNRPTGRRGRIWKFAEVNSEAR